jgi:GNAT superfamily N-acetyltransferase
MYGVDSERAAAHPAGHADGLQFRPARAEDAAACAPLIFASGVGEFGFFLGQPDERCIAFLRFAFTSKHGRFSYRRHHVALTSDNKVIAVLAVHDGRRIWLDDPHVALMLLMFFGLRRTVSMLLRGLVLESELPAPKSSQTLMAHCATDAQNRGTGVFSALFASVFASALRAGSISGEPGRQLVLDVLVSNRRAYDLYRRLGFVELPRRAPVSHRLPRQLESIRMQYMDRI